MELKVGKKTENNVVDIKFVSVLKFTGFTDFFKVNNSPNAASNHVYLVQG